jgi:hypothetical protein
VDNVKDQNQTIEYPVGDADVNLTVLALSATNGCLFAGTDSGNVRVYEWPLNGAFVEYPVHKAAVTGLRVTVDHARLISVGEDGSMFIMGIQRVEGGVELPFVLDTEPDADMINAEFFLVAQEELFDRQQELNELRKQVGVGVVGGGGGVVDTVFGLWRSVHWAEFQTIT